MTTPFVSVITPSFNSQKYIKETYISLAKQTILDWEWLVTDDGSTDNTPKILKSLAIDDLRIKVDVRNNNGGPAVARNCSIARSKGRYIAFLDADDQWLPEKLERQIRFMEDNKYVFTHSWYQPVNPEGQSVGMIVTAPERMNYQDMLKSNRIGCLTAVYDTYALDKVYMPLLRKRQDYALWLQLLKITPYVYCIPECLALYRTGMSSVSSNKLEMLKHNWKLYREVEQFPRTKSVYYLGWNIFRKLMK